jgi:hypothetical protein
LKQSHLCQAYILYNCLCNHLADNKMDENYFSILWHEDGTRTVALGDYLKSSETV